MSNKRNQRRGGQRIRSEINRKPAQITKAMVAFVTGLPAERKRKEQERYRLTKKARQESEKWLRRWRVTGKVRRARKQYRAVDSKPRRVYGATYWKHSHDV